ncbi:MAG: hypothetical protein ACFB01_11620 [Cohaesibacteraceae bacterium]
MDEFDRIKAGVSAGIITPDQAQALRQLPVAPSAEQFAALEASDEPFALFRGFRDVFLALGIIILALGLGGVASEVFGLQIDGVVGFDDVSLALGLAVIAWLVAEWVTARLRMPLASLVTCLAFTFALAVAATLLLIATGAISDGGDAPTIALALFFALAGLVFYVRFRLPFAMLLIAGGSAFAIYNTVEAAMGGNADGVFQFFAGITGLMVLAVALSYELRDPERRKRQSENAFWLHLLAAPLIVFSLVGGLDAMDISNTYEAVRVFLVVTVLGLLALLIDRRAFIVSALLYLGGAIAYAISQSGMPSNVQFAATALVLGIMIVALALGWHPLRRLFLGILPAGFSARLPNPAQPDTPHSVHG